MGVTSSRPLGQLDASTYQPHRLHLADRIWPETNCYVDLWTEVLHSLGLDPLAGLAFTLSSDFDGEQWEFFKHPQEDLRLLYGIEVREINVWRQIDEHIVRHLELGHLLTVEVDSWYLPDTAGVSYRLNHQKTTIVPGMIDRRARRLGYFHNRSYFELTGEDFDGVMRVDVPTTALAPYTEVVDLHRISRVDDHTLHERAARLVSDHLLRRPGSNPVQRLGERVISDVSWLCSEPPDTFHAYAFGTLRQCGAWAETLAAFVDWFGGGVLASATHAFTDLAATAKTCQFKLARAASGRPAELDGLFASMTDQWARGYAALESTRAQ